MQSADGSLPLLEIVRERIRQDGPMPLDRYMQICLTHPEHGYYRTAPAIGAGGDFLTAPEISQIFGELIGLWAGVTWERMGRPTPLRLVELGPGRGTLIADALRAGKLVGQFLDAVSVHLVEIGAPQREAQRDALGSWSRVAWHSELGEVPDGHAILVANEFLDALPIRQLIHDGRTWRERVVEVGRDGALVFGAGEEVDYASETARPGTIVEIRSEEAALLSSLALRQAPVVALFIDYGPAEPVYGDTLQAVRRHAYADPLAEPGQADLTAHVQFADFAEKARRVGFATDGPLTQGEFLGALGAAERAARLMAHNPAEAADIEAAVKRLLSPTGMGGLCKVLAVRSPALPPPPPFG
jgi:SAM-dependent MidA family methyltransferase